MSNDDKEKRKTIIGSRVRVVVGDAAQLKDNEDVVVLGEDIKLVVGVEEAKTVDKIVGKEVIVHVGDFDPIIRQIDTKENIDTKTKKELKAKVVELEEELRGRQDKNKIKGIFNYFKDNAYWLIPAISKLLETYMHTRHE